MSDEITVSCSLRLTNGDLKESRSANSVRADQTNQKSIGGVQAIGTVEEAITVGDLATTRFAYFRNLDATNYVEIGVKPAFTFYPLLLLSAGDPPQLIKIASGVTLYARAHTAAVNIDKLILDE